MHPRCGMPGFDLHDQPLAVLAGADDAANKRGSVTPPRCEMDQQLSVPIGVGIPCRVTQHAWMSV